MKKVLAFISLFALAGCYQGSNQVLSELDNWLERCVKNANDAKQEMICHSKYLAIVNTCKMSHGTVDPFCIRSRIENKEVNHE